MTNIPLVDLKAQCSALEDEIKKGWSRVLRDTAFILGSEVTDFEADFARFCGVKHCIGVANGTDAIELALRSLDIEAGDEVILPANTFMATPLAVMRAGARPVIVDSDPHFHLLDPSQLEARITKKTRAIVPVHLYGQVAPMAPIRSIASAHGLEIVEDAAQAQGAKQHDRPAGSLGKLAATSFYPGKNLGAFGDAGAVLTDSDEHAANVRALRNYGSDIKYQHPKVGFNSRLDTLQAVVLRVKLQRLAEWNASRRKAAARYDALLKGASDVEIPKTLPGNRHVWHLYVVRVPRRNKTIKRLHAAGIGAGIHYPIPIHLQGALSHLGHGEGSFPVAEKAAAEILSLPLFPEITAEQQERVVEALL
ncbi:DegT/DnrJ/EryC1/StrS family aminotransferase [Desulfobulbus sp. AH-315-M07]|nr:DegT/DnrJ/EryC1/StrS family aminotransferase [Desulfobulbus sp. AH-315-M07]